MRCFFLVVLLPIAALAADPPEQAKRGKELFFLKSATGYSCAGCHSLAGEGTAIGPDLKIMGGLHPRAVVMGILASRTQYVKEVTITKGNTFPGIKSGDQFFDLSKNPPAPFKLTELQQKGLRDNVTWKHPPESRGLSKDQLADLIAYIRFASTGDTKGVDPKDLN